MWLGFSVPVVSMTRFYDQDGSLLAVRFCGDKPSSYWQTERQREKLASLETSWVMADTGYEYTADEFLRMLASGNLASADEVLSRFETLDLS